ncbi:glycosyltransferase involved in cell wall biosynthesis [Curtobacterium sp. AG1037]|uniref:glycosyltransferase family 4 protein n=1 Tax=Curtobacterium sp. AG1037 TaxID=2183990 RepID=UPI000E0BF43E|nr:glycosyltransferase family 4 protein [Curtobacterium sp. AG1037]RDH98528.1 glycosyltransferase involved in cell wall biosynthesis [Curtobacterium sp. AG1037]
MNISWFTNVAAPYRMPIWDHVRKNHQLKVHLLETPDSLAKEGRRPSDWAPTLSDDFEQVPNYTFRHGEKSYYFARKLRLIPQRTDVALLGGWESPVYFQLLFETKFRHVRSVGFYESTLKSNSHSSGPIAAARSTFFRALDAVVVPGEAAEEALLSFGVQPTRIHRGFNAIDVAMFNDAARQAWAQHRDRPQGGRRYVFVGQLIDRKNPELLLRAFHKSASIDDSLTFVGQGDLRSDLLELTRRFALEDRVEFMDYVTNESLASLLPTFDTLVLPSEQEVWGLVVNEALAAGLSVVVSSNAGVSRSVASMAGVTVVPPTLEAISAALRGLSKLPADHIVSPEILKYTPEAFSDVFLEAMRVR